MTQTGSKASIATRAMTALMSREDIRDAVKDAEQGDDDAGDFVKAMQQFCVHHADVLQTALDNGLNSVLVAPYFGCYGPEDQDGVVEVGVSKLERLLTEYGVFDDSTAYEIMSLSRLVNWRAALDATADAYEVNFERDGWGGWAYVLEMQYAVVSYDRIELLHTWSATECAPGHPGARFIADQGRNNMDWNAIGWSKKIDHTPGYAALSDLMTHAALGGSRETVNRALKAYAAASLHLLTEDERLTLDELYGDVLAQQYALMWEE